MERRTQIEEALNLISHQQSQLKKGIKEGKEESGSSLDDNMTELRKPQISVVHRARPSVSFTSPYGNLPSRMSNSDTLKEMFEDEPSPRRRQKPMTQVLETPVQYLATSPQQSLGFFKPSRPGTQKFFY
jgi:hypothetical protein